MCLNNQCQNGGTCHPVDLDSFVCSCKPDFTGSKCEQCKKSRLAIFILMLKRFFFIVLKTKYCDFNYCNNGNCTIQPSGLIKCICKNGYIGQKCQIESNVCARQTCHSRGLCVPKMDNNYQCLCNRNN